MKTVNEFYITFVKKYWTRPILQYRYVVDSKMNDSLSNEKDILRYV